MRFRGWDLISENKLPVPLLCLSLLSYCAQDTRYDETSIATHDRQLLPAVSATTLSHLTCRARDYDVIGKAVLPQSFQVQKFLYRVPYIVDGTSKKIKIWANLRRFLVLFTQRIVTKLSKIWVWDPRSGSGIRRSLFWIPNPRAKKALDPGYGSAASVPDPDLHGFALILVGWIRLRLRIRIDQKCRILNIGRNTVFGREI